MVHESKKHPLQARTLGLSSKTMLFRFPVVTESVGNPIRAGWGLITLSVSRGGRRGVAFLCGANMSSLFEWGAAESTETHARLIGECVTVSSC